MSFIYNVTIVPTAKEPLFHITWHNTETNTLNSFSQPAEMTSEETRTLWHHPEQYLVVGQKLFRFLDGDSRHFLRALDQAKKQGHSLQVNLRTSQQTADWPFELLAKDDTFLLPHQLHLVRCVSDWGRAQNITPQNRPLKLLFMACSAADVKPELDFEREEETIFHITENLAIDMEIEYSGSLKGLRIQLEQEQYDVVHLSGYTNFDQNGCPYFIMEDEIGAENRVFPENLWEDALIENPPRLLFLSGSRFSDASYPAYPPDSMAAVSFGRLLVKNYPVPAVLEMGHSMRDEQTTYAGKTLYRKLSRGRSILDAIQRTRHELLKNFPKNPNPAWPRLRLFSTGMALNALVEKNLPWQPRPRRMKHVYLKHSQVKVLIQGFVGRRRQLQTSLRTLKKDFDKMGVLILGAAGLGKSALAGKICEQFTDYTLIIVNGKLNSITLEEALKDAFIISQDEKGQQILSQKREITTKLPDLFATSFKEKNYLLLLDNFDQNLENTDKDQTGLLTLEAADLLEVLLHYLPISGKMTQLIITSRYDFSLTQKDRNLVKERLEKVWLPNFNESEQQKKAQHQDEISAATEKHKEELSHLKEIMQEEVVEKNIPTPIQNIMPKVFITYAQEDFDRVKFLADFLKGQGINVFIDREFLKIGEDWKSSIQNKIQEECDFFLICLSKTAVKKKGFIQKEIRIAYEIRDLLPDHKAFILPIRLDDCIVPQKIAHFYWKDWFSNSDTETLYNIAENIKEHFKSALNE